MPSEVSAGLTIVRIYNPSLVVCGYVLSLVFVYPLAACVCLSKLYVSVSAVVYVSLSLWLCVRSTNMCVCMPWSSIYIMYMFRICKGVGFEQKNTNRWAAGIVMMLYCGISSYWLELFILCISDWLCMYVCVRVTRQEYGQWTFIQEGTMLLLEQQIRYVCFWDRQRDWRNYDIESSNVSLIDSLIHTLLCISRTQ